MVKPHLLSMLCLSADLLVVLPWRDPFRDLPDRSWQHPGILAVSACGSSLTVELLWATGGVQTSVGALVHWWPASLPTQSMEYVWQHGKPHNGHNGTMANSHRYHTHGAVGWNDASNGLWTKSLKTLLAIRSTIKYDFEQTIPKRLEVNTYGRNLDCVRLEMVDMKDFGQ